MSKTQVFFCAKKWCVIEIITEYKKNQQQRKISPLRIRSSRNDNWSGASISKHRSFPESKNKNQIRVLIFELRYKKTIHKQSNLPHSHLELSREIYPKFRYSQTQQLSKKNPSSKKSNHLRKISPLHFTSFKMTIGEKIFQNINIYYKLN